MTNQAAINEAPKDPASSPREMQQAKNGMGGRFGDKAFVALAVNGATTGSRKFGVVAVTKDGRELPGARNESGHVGAGIRAESFTFDVPLTEVAKFRIGTRPIRVKEWEDVVLPRH